MARLGPTRTRSAVSHGAKMKLGHWGKEAKVARVGGCILRIATVADQLTTKRVTAVGRAAEQREAMQRRQGTVNRNRVGGAAAAAASTSESLCSVERARGKDDAGA